jgi:putative hemolysin
MISVCKGRYGVRVAQTHAEHAQIMDLRCRVFRNGKAPDRDSFDDICDHILVEDAKTGRVIGCFRILTLPDAAAIDTSYAARFYDLCALRDFGGPVVELGRFCIDPDYKDPDILRIAWAALTRHVDDMGVKMLFGCASFNTAQATDHGAALALLGARHLGPQHWQPKIKAPDICAYTTIFTQMPDLQKAQAQMPPLLRSYLLMGGWVSDHAVIDHDLNTLHVFTALLIKSVPPARARLLRRLAGQ